MIRQMVKRKFLLKTYLVQFLSNIFLEFHNNSLINNKVVLVKKISYFNKKVFFLNFFTKFFYLSFFHNVL